MQHLCLLLILPIHPFIHSLHCLSYWVTGNPGDLGYKAWYSMDRMPVSRTHTHTLQTILRCQSAYVFGLGKETRVQRENSRSTGRT
ncbi:hypothetical protein QTP86_025466 [Hemibagrus guttatus]|nr:hypothetical protein QTP86_025466 [Hemibagrus guttatus]